MSRDIDLSKPLSDEDRAYLKQRSRHAELAFADSQGKELSDEERQELEQKAIAETKGKRVPLQMDPDVVRQREGDDEDEVEADEGDDPDDVAFVNSLSGDELREHLESRGLPQKGNKTEMKRRLLDALKNE